MSHTILKSKHYESKAILKEKLRDLTNNPEIGTDQEVARLEIVVAIYERLYPGVSEVWECT